MKFTLKESLRNLALKVGLTAVMALMAFSTNIVFFANRVAIAATVDSGYEQASEEILWFARTIYSETKKADEQTLVAWVIRNRVESVFFPDTYKEVVLQKGQFSGMHATDKQYEINIGMDYDDSSPAWDSALAIARSVYFAESILRPFPKTVMHFFSPISVASTPAWASKIDPVHEVVDPATNTVRFAFYADIM